MLGANGIDAEHAGLIALAMLIGVVAGMAAVPAWPALRTHLRWTIPIAALLGVPLSLLLTHGSHAGALYVVGIDRKSTRLNSSLMPISSAVFCLKIKRHTH